MRMYAWIGAAVALLTAGVVAADFNVVGGAPFAAGRGNAFSVTIEDTDVAPAGTMGLLVEQSATFTQLSADKRLVFTNNGTDSLKAWVAGLDSAAQVYRKEPLIAAGSGGTATTGRAYYAVEAFWLDHETDGTATLTPAGGSVMNTIPAGAIHRSPALRVFGTRSSPIIDRLTAACTDSLRVDVELRVYDDIADVRDLGDGYAVRAKGRVDPTAGTVTWDFPHGIKLSQGAIAAVYAAGPTNASVSVTLEGRYK